jgi:general secretion pathway protein C
MYYQRESGKMREMPIARSNNPAQTAAVYAATFAALMLLAVVLAYWTWAWFGPRAAPRAEPMSEPVSRSTLASTLFGSLQSGPAAVAPTGLAIKLVGVVAASGNKPSYAVVQVDAKTILAVRAGEEIAPGIRLDKVFSDHVTLQRGGASEALALAERQKPVPAAAPGAK